ncbi:MAG TPA: HD domain-containing phosphohydrolase [Polyangiales bacterium]|nr:HD domain-containing phosphohydrolase [Polyangiales bacterium]
MDLDALLRDLQADARWADAQLSKSNEGLEVARERARVLLIDGARVLQDPEMVERAVRGDFGLLIVGAAPPGLKGVLKPGSTVAVLDDGADGDQAFLAIDGLLERVELKQSAASRVKELSRYRYELDELVTIARALTQERDIDKLLGLILEKSRYITGADAGSIYVLEESREDKAPMLRFKLSQNDSVTFQSREFTIPVSTKSIAGAAALIKQPIMIPDVYRLDPDKPYTFARSFDERVGYRSVSMLTVPMISAEDEVIGVIQLINKKANPRAKLTKPEDFETGVVPFDARSEELLTTLASQAGIALENALLYEEIRTIFEGFVRASVQAIEQRDPTTSGHSLRVSVLSCALAEKVDGISDGPFKDTKFSRRDLQELQYASLLHDFGKIGVREQVLVKAKKLYPHQADSIRARIEYAIKSAEAASLAQRVALMQKGAGGAELAQLDDELAAKKAELLAAWDTIQKANEPTVLKEGDFSRIAGIGAITYADFEGNPRRLLSEDEVVALQIPRGSLSPNEYDEIRSHVVHTYNFLSKIPWGKSMAQVPVIAGAHHERINGTGYPRGVTGPEIPVQSKIMTIADIYDALTARDRPYKRALPAERALEILSFEVKDGHLDPALVEIFRVAEVFKAADRDLTY